MEKFTYSLEAFRKKRDQKKENQIEILKVLDRYAEVFLANTKLHQEAIRDNDELNKYSIGENLYDQQVTIIEKENELKELGEIKPELLSAYPNYAEYKKHNNLDYSLNIEKK